MNKAENNIRIAFFIILRFKKRNLYFIIYFAFLKILKYIKIIFNPQLCKNKNIKITKNSFSHKMHYLKGSHKEKWEIALEK